MLVLTRKVDQGIIISGNIHVRVLGVERDRVKIGIDAPRDIAVLRQELVERERNDANKEEPERAPKDGDRESARSLPAREAGSAP